MSTETAALSQRGADAKSDRLAAFFIDFCILSAGAFSLWVVTFFLNAVVSAGAFAWSSGAPSSEMAGGSLLAASLLSMVVNAVLWLAIGVLLVWYFAYYSATGETYGKRNQGLAVVDADGDPVTTRQRLVRTAILLAPFPFMALFGTFLGGFGFVFALVFMTGWLLIEGLVLLITDGGQRIGDLLVDTYVVAAEN